MGNNKRIKCPLCSSEKCTSKGTINTRLLTELYKKNLDVIITPKDDIIYLFLCGNCSLYFYNPVDIQANNLYEKLEKFPWYYLKEKFEYNFASTFVKTKSKVLEIGAGRGYFKKYIPHSDYLALEKNSKAISWLRNRKIDVNDCDLKDIIKTKMKYDVVCVFHVLEHLSDPNTFIQDCITCLNKNGVLIFAVPNNDSFLKYGVNDILNMPPHHYTRWTDDTFRFIGAKYDLEILSLENEHLNPNHLFMYIISILNHRINSHRELLSKNFKFKCTNYLGHLLGFLIRPFFKIMEMSPELLPSGFTKVIIYRFR